MYKQDGVYDALPSSGILKHNCTHNDNVSRKTSSLYTLKTPKLVYPPLNA